MMSNPPPPMMSMQEATVLQRHENWCSLSPGEGLLATNDHGIILRVWVLVNMQVSVLSWIAKGSMVSRSSGAKSVLWT